MSVAFTKEEDNEAAAAFLPERPISPHPNWVTARGLAELDAALADRKSTRLNSSHMSESRMPSSA